MSVIQSQYFLRNVIPFTFIVKDITKTIGYAIRKSFAIPWKHELPGSIVYNFQERPQVSNRIAPLRYLLQGIDQGFYLPKQVSYQKNLMILSCVIVNLWNVCLARESGSTILAVELTEEMPYMTKEGHCDK